VLGDKCAVKMPRGPLTGRERSEIDSLLASGHLYHDKDCDFVALTDAGRAAMGLPRLRCDLVYDANVIPGLERQAAAAIMAREPDLLRAHIACLESLDRRLLRACQEEFVLREPVEPLLCDGAYPSAEAVCAAIANLHYGALVEFRKLGATWVAITGMDIDDVKVALRKGAGKMGWPDILETLIDWGLEPAPWMAAMARDARCPECLGFALALEHRLQCQGRSGADDQQGRAESPDGHVDHVEAAESWLAVCQGEASQWPTVQAISTEAGAHALVDIAESLRGLREDLQALTAAVREAAETGVRVVTD
jgi:hypothetical protein